MTDQKTAAAIAAEDAERAYVDSRQARVDRVVNNLGSRFNAAQGTPLAVDASTTSRPNIRYNTATDTFTYLDGGATVPAAEVARMAAEQDGEARVYDNGVSIPFAIGQMQREHARLKGLLEEVVFDARTGVKIPVLQGDQRRVTELLFKQHNVNCEEQCRIFAKLQRQRDMDREANEQAAIDEASLEETIRREAQARAFELEVEDRAQAILRENRRRERGG